MALGAGKDSFKIIILGESGVGKTSTINRWVQRRFSFQYKATIGADYFDKDLLVDGRRVHVQIWDTAGMERFQSLGTAFYRGADACALVYDVTHEKSFQQLGREFLLQAAPRNPASFPFVVIGNKVDQGQERKVPRARAIEWCNEQSAQVSAKEAVAVDEAFIELVRLAMANVQRQVATPDLSGLRLQQKPYERQKKEGAVDCCLIL